MMANCNAVLGTANLETPASGRPTQHKKNRVPSSQKTRVEIRWRWKPES
jgi:hypothetical protein